MRHDPESGYVLKVCPLGNFNFLHSSSSPEVCPDSSKQIISPLIPQSIMYFYFSFTLILQIQLIKHFLCAKALV
jgi:hypothetical protein